MRTITCLLALLTVILIGGCNNNHKVSKNSDGYSNQDALLSNVVGSYVGKLPCVDCVAINTILKLKDDRSYKLTYWYDGKSEDEYTKEGLWMINKNDLVLKGLDYKFKVKPDFLVQLDLTGKVITGDLAEMYQLAKVK